MNSPRKWAARLAGLALIAWPSWAHAQDDGLLSLDEALQRSGVAAVGPVDPANPRIVGPQQDVAAAEALIEQARLRPNPEVSLEVENIAGTGAFSGLRASEYTLAAALPLELGGKRRARVEAAQADLAVARLRGDLALADLGLLVRQRYVTAVAAQARVELFEDILERERELARIARALVDAGREPPLRALRAEAALAETEAELKAAQADALAARFAVGALWGEEVAPEIPASFPDIDPPYELLADYRGLQTQIAAAEREAAEAAVARERTLRIPDPTVSAGVRRFEGSNEQAFLVGVSVPLPLFNRNQGNIAAAQARARAAAARQAVTGLDYRQEVIDTRAAYFAAEARAATLETESLPRAEEALRLVQIGYRNGRFPLIEVLAAAEARDNIRRSLIEAREAQERTAARLIGLAAQ